MNKAEKKLFAPLVFIGKITISQTFIGVNTLFHRFFLVALCITWVGIGITVHMDGLDVLLWQDWKLNRRSIPQGAIDLSRYRVDIVAKSVRGVNDDLSALTYNPIRNSLFAVINGEPLLVELSLEGDLLRRVHIHGVSDIEGLTHIDANRYIIAEENTHRLILIIVPDDAEVVDTKKAPSLTVGLDMSSNKGFEGLSWDDSGRRLLVVKERDPLKVLVIKGFSDAGTGQPLNVTIEEIERSDSPKLFMTDLSSLTVHKETGHLLLLSHESRMVVEYDAGGQPLSLMGLRNGWSGLIDTVPQAEGIAVDAQRRVYVVSEPNLFYRFVADS